MTQIRTDEAITLAEIISALNRFDLCDLCEVFCDFWLHNGWGFDAEVAEGAGHLALGYCCGGEQKGFAGGVGLVEDVVAVVEVVELLR